VGNLSHHWRNISITLIDPARTILSVFKIRVLSESAVPSSQVRMADGTSRYWSIVMDLGYIAAGQ